MDADGWRKPLTSKVFGECGLDLRRAIANVIKKLRMENVEDQSLEAFTACELVPLDKKPGVRPIGVGEVLRRICGKVMMAVLQKDVLKSSAEIQMCSGQKSSSEAAIHAMREVFDSEETEAVLLVDAANAFNSINREALLHNVKIVCPTIACYVINFYRFHARLFIIGGKEIRSEEGTTQGDPLGMAIYAIGLTPLLNLMADGIFETTVAAFADDVSAGGKCRNLKVWWDRLMQIGPLFGYNPQPYKSWLIVKPGHEQLAKATFEGTNIQICTDGERHLGASIESDSFRKEYCEKMVTIWVKEISLLSDIALSQPQAAYPCYTSGYQHKFSFFLRTIPGIEKYLNPLEEIIRHRLLPAITGGHIVNDDERTLLSLPPRLGGLGIINPIERAPTELRNSESITASLKNVILRENVVDEEIVSLKAVKNNRRQQNLEKLKNLQLRMTPEAARLNESNMECGVSNWLTTLPIKELNYDLNKEQFFDALRL
ncbi:uncharacterized protein LOC130646905 [Hydractinia symbiolongicarpus]|uniref:uncharacterized protein LOC130646905 n=1 Tax=Hydractinia symbiolongicarpus TaxID=13093 RepID=UPI00254B0389|nr:uncharacterized protein LOC130646905 [Hydractinia symbiolongicarpus]